MFQFFALTVFVYISSGSSFRTPSAPFKTRLSYINEGINNGLLDEKPEISTEPAKILWKYFDTFTSSLSSQTAYTSDVFIKFEEFETKPVPEEKSGFVLPTTRAWLSVVSPSEAEKITAPPLVVPPAVVTPPDVMTFLKTGVLSAHHESKVKELFAKTSSLSYLDARQSQKVLHALRIAYCAFWGKRTVRSLEVLINRARGTAAVLGELKADAEIIVVGILHDVLSELSSAELFHEIRAELIHIFGFEAIELVETYSRLPKFFAKKTEYTPESSENLMQMLVSLADNYRILYVRLADRVHTMRVLRSLPLGDAERVKIAQEALHVYAPLAHKMGVMSLKGELEDLAFRVLKPELYLDSKRTQWLAHKALHDGSIQIQDLITKDPFLIAQNISFRLPYRVKDKYQLALKMARKNLKSVNDVRDAVGMRVIIDAPRLDGESDEAYVKRGEANCYYIVDKIRALDGWEPTEKGYKDYIQHRKANGYQSLHQYMRSKALDTHLEVQVRTIEMHRLAELGEAAHWNYKDHLYRPEIAASKMYKTAWRSAEQQALAKSPADLIGYAKKQLNAERVFVFLGDESTVLNLRKGATALDTAFAIHTSIGLSASRVLVNGQPVGLKRVMQNGDVIRVECAPAAAVTVKPAWLSIARLAYTQGVIRKCLRQRHRATLAVLGLVQLVATLAANKHLVLRFHESVPTAYKLQRLAVHAGHESAGEFLAQLGQAVASQGDQAALTAGLLGVPSEELLVRPISHGLSWMRTQLKQGFADHSSLRNLVLAPLLRELLPAAGVVEAEGRWRDLLGLDIDLTTATATSTASAHTVSSPAVAAEQQVIIGKISVPFGLSGVFSRGSGALLTPKSYLKSQIVLAQKPFSLHGTLLATPLQRLAKREVAASVLRLASV